mgnify:CR=1 FL=1
MSARSDVLLWANRIVNKGSVAPHHLLEIREGAGLDEAQAAATRVWIVGIGPGETIR